MPARHATCLLHAIEETRAAIAAARQAGDTLGFVPTMGALHAGHLSLVEASLEACDRTIVSIFVNPTQFAPGEDLDRYPRTLEADFRQLEQLGCWLVFAPSVEAMFPEGSETRIDVGSVARTLEGAARPEHFAGVATVVLKLLQMIPADRAFFGQKDYQQTLVIKQLVRDLCVPVTIEVCPTVREPDGLAMSSRNVYLSPEARREALSLSQALGEVARLHAQGVREVREIRSQLEQHFAAFPGVSVEYLAFLEAGTVRPVSTLVGPTVVALAAQVGQTRLIDNRLIG
jgi:pantoate--beta-alanine ligase